MNGTLLLPLALLAIVGLIALFRHIHSNTPTAQYGNLIADRAIAGATGGDIDTEMTLRMTAARFRRRVSMAAVENPTRYEEFILEFGKEEAILLAVTDKAAAKSFVDWVQSAGLSEILLPVAMKAVWKTVGARWSGDSRVPIDLVGALRVRG